MLWDINQSFSKSRLELLLENTRCNADTNSNPDLLTHIIHANCCCHMLLWSAVIQPYELCGQDNSSKETEWKAYEGRPGV